MTAPRGTIVVTGANGGLGTAIARNIVSDPGLVSAYHGVYTVRDVAATTSLQSALQASTKPHSHDLLPLDLSTPSSVRNAATAINAKVSAGEMPRIRALILNAAMREPQGQTRTESGLDVAFAGNYLGHWLLVLLLLESMDLESGRVVIVGAWAHDPLDKANKASGAFEEEEWKKIFADANFETIESVAKGMWSASPDDPSKDPKGLSGIRRYGASKLCSIMMLFELQRRLDSDPKLGGISVVGVDPGMMPTKITTGTLGWFIHSLFLIITHIASRISPNGMMRLPGKSASDVLAAALQTGPPYGERPKGLYFNGPELKEVSVEAKDVEKRASVWKASIEYSGLNEGETCLADWA